MRFRAATRTKFTVDRLARKDFELQENLHSLVANEARRCVLISSGLASDHDALPPFVDGSSLLLILRAL